MIRNACKAVGSISSTAFDVRFNPDIFSPGGWWSSRWSELHGAPWASMLVACPHPERWSLSCCPRLPPPAQACALPAGVRFPESCQAEVRDQKQLLKDAAAFLLSCQIPGLVREGPRGGCVEGLLQALVPRPSLTWEASQEWRP